MIRKLNNDDLDHVMKIWLEANITAHSFIPQSYWNKQFGYIRKVIPEAEIYIYENVQEIIGFIGLSDNYIAGLFVAPRSQSEGIGKQLLDYIKSFRPELYLKVYRKNHRAVRFYERESFIIQSETIDPATGEKEFLMKFYGCK